MTDATNQVQAATKTKAPKAAKAKAPKAARNEKPKAVKTPKAPKGGTKRRREATDLIQILTQGGKNPRRAGFGHDHFEVMKKSKTVGAYLDKFQKGDARDTASQWLWNTVRDGFVKLVDATSTKS
jgi:hypothetical protein